MDTRDEGRLEALNDMRGWLVKNRTALTVELSTGEYMGVDDMLDFIDRMARTIKRGEGKQQQPPEQSGSDAARRM